MPTIKELNVGVGDAVGVYGRDDAGHKTKELHQVKIAAVDANAVIITPQVYDCNPVELDEGILGNRLYVKHSGFERIEDDTEAY